MSNDVQAGAIAPQTESDARLKALADSLPHAMIYQLHVSADGARRRFTFVGRSCERLNGVSAEALLADARLLEDLIAPEDRDAVLAAEAEATATLAPFDIEAGFIRPDGERRWSRISSAPRLLPDGSILWDGIQLDITDSRLDREALATEQNRLALAVEAAGLGLWEYDVRRESLSWDDGVRAVYGLAPNASVTYETYLKGLHPDDRETAVATYMRAMESGASGYRMEHRTLAPDGTVRWVLGCARILRQRNGTPLRVIGTTLDITDRKRGEERLQLMVHELNHRVKNSMAVVQAIAARTLRNSAPETAARNLTSRLLALSQAHDVLTAEAWQGAGLLDVATRSLGAVGADRARVELSGPPVRLRPTAAVTFALVFHELATNALKYGAFSTDTGRVAVLWSLDSEGKRLSLCWRETGGPPVQTPTRRGFGSQLIRRGLSVEAGGEVRMTYAAAGLVCEIEGDMERLSPRS